MSRTNRLLSAVLGATLTLTACGGGSDTAAPSEAQKAAAGSSAAPSSQPPVSDYRVDPPVVPAMPHDAQAVQQFGEENVRSAYDEAVEFASTVLYTPERAVTWNADLTPADFTDLTMRMTPGFGDQFADLVATALTEDETVGGPATFRVAFAAVWALVDDGQPLTLRPDRLLVTDQIVTDPKIHVDDQNRLVVGFHHTASLHFLKNGTPGHSVYTRDISFPMVQAPEGGERSWLIDEILGKGQLSELVTTDH